MPELPEVETFVRALRRPLVGRTIVGATNDWPRHIVAPLPDELAARIAGRRIEAIDRRGKYLVFTLSDDENLIIHLKMTGHLSVVPADTPRDPYAHTVFALNDGRELRFRDPRKFGRVYLLRDPAGVLGPLGPEPLGDDFTAGELAARLAGRRRVLKPLLLDQTFIAGIGNIYSDEILYVAGLHPLSRVERFEERQLKALYRSIRSVLRLAIRLRGTGVDAPPLPAAQAMGYDRVRLVYHRTTCPRGHPLTRIKVGGRSAHFCATEQELM